NPTLHAFPTRRSSDLIVTNHRMLCYRDFDAARRRDDMKYVAPFYPEVVWHPERGRLNNRIPPDYLERQVVPAIAKKQQLTKLLLDRKSTRLNSSHVAI